MSIDEVYDKFVKKELKKIDGEPDKKMLRNIAYKFINDDSKKEKKKSYWLTFNKDDGNREDCNVYYSNLVYCYSEKEAKTIAAIEDEVAVSHKGAIKMKVLTIDTMNKYFFGL